MAKLSARGRTELARVTRDYTSEKDPLTEKSRITIAFMSDGKILRKRVVWFRREGLPSERHDYGWKLWQKYNPDNLEVLVKPLLDKGWTKE